jgi:GT2 family glycosyltransferase
MLSRNYGFSGGVNRGIAALAPECEYVLLLNDDAWLDGAALPEMYRALSTASQDVVSVAPKIVLATHDVTQAGGVPGGVRGAVPGGVIDAVGMAVNRRGEAKNVGLGQPDLGQFDEPKSIFGPCFAAALFRRSAFDSAAVGPLPESYFLYYEDVAWNWRAQLLGRGSLSAPGAVAFHHMSGSSRADEFGLRASESAYANKHRYIERNLMVTATLHLPTADVRRLWTQRFPGLVKSSAIGRFPQASRAAVGGALRALPRALAARRALHRHGIDDRAEAALRFWDDEPIHFDPVTYQPTFSWAALRAAARGAGLTALAAACEHECESEARTAIESITSVSHRINAAEFLTRVVM